MSRRPFWTIGFGLALALAPGTAPTAHAQFRKPAEPPKNEEPAPATEPAAPAPAPTRGRATTPQDDATNADATKPATDPQQPTGRTSPFNDPKMQKRILRSMVTGQGSMGFGGRNSGGLTNLVLRSTALQEELKLTEDQKKQIEDINKQSGDRMTEMRRKMQDNREEGQRFDFNQMRDSFRTMGQESQDAALRVLTKEQKQRLNQIALQIEGPTALAKPEIGSQVNLSPPQQQQVQAIVNAFTTALEQQRQQQMQQFAAMMPGRGGRGGPGGGGPGGGGPGGFGPGGGPGGGGPGGFGPGAPGGFARGGPGGGPGGFGPGGGGPAGPGGFGPGGPGGGRGGPGGFAQGGPGGFGPGAATNGNRFAQGGPGGRGQGGPGGPGGPGGAAAGNQTDRRAMFAQMQEQAKKRTEDEDKLLEQTEARIAKVLTVKQRKSFNTLLGEPYDLAKLLQNGIGGLFGGGGRGGPGGGGPGGGRGGRGGGNNN